MNTKGYGATIWIKGNRNLRVKHYLRFVYMHTRNYYELFGVSENAKLLEIKKAYRRLAFKHHPDRNGGSATSEAMFKEINHAYDMLSDVYQRTEYDRELARQRNPQKAYTQQAHNPYSNGGKQQPGKYHQPEPTGIPWRYYVMVPLAFCYLLMKLNSHKPERETYKQVDNVELQTIRNQSANKYIVPDAVDRSGYGMVMPDTNSGAVYFFKDK